MMMLEKKVKLRTGDASSLKNHLSEREKKCQKCEFSFKKNIFYFILEYGQKRLLPLQYTRWRTLN